MTRKSRREIERALEELGGGGPTAASPHTPLADVYDDAIVSLVHEVCRELLQIRLHHPETIANAPRDDAVPEFLACVRDKFAIEDDRDAVVREAFASECDTKGQWWDEITLFAMAPVACAAGSEPVTSADELLSELVDAGRGPEARRLLVQATYHALAEQGDSRGQEAVA